MRTLATIFISYPISVAISFAVGHYFGLGFFATGIVGIVVEVLMYLGVYSLLGILDD